MTNRALTFLLFSLLAVAQQESIHTTPCRTEAQAGLMESVLAENLYEIRIITFRSFVTQTLAICRGRLALHYVKEADTANYLMLHFRQQLDEVGTTAFGHGYVKCVAFDWYKFWDFYTTTNGTKHYGLNPDIQGQGLEPPFYCMEVGVETGVGTPLDVQDVVEGHCVLKLFNMSIPFNDGSIWRWENTEVTIVYEFRKEESLWRSSIPTINTTLPLEHAFDETTNTLTIFINALPAMFWTSAVALTFIAALIPLALFTILWMRKKRKKPLVAEPPPT